MIEPLFWLGVLSILLAVVGLATVIVAALPAYRELARAARSAEKLFDTLSRELPPTLEAIRLTGLEISDLTDDISGGVQSARNVVKQVDQSIDETKQQARAVRVNTRSVFTGVKIAWRNLLHPQRHDSRLRDVSAGERATSGHRKTGGKAPDRPVNYLSQSKQAAADFPKVKHNRHLPASQETFQGSNDSSTEDNFDTNDISQNIFREQASDEPFINPD